MLRATTSPSLLQPTGITAKKIGVGACLWDGALVLAAYLLTLPRHRFHGTRCVELGAGVGTAGLVAALLGAQAIITDIPKVLPLLLDNLAANGFDPAKNGCGRVEEGGVLGSSWVPVETQRHVSAYAILTFL